MAPFRLSLVVVVLSIARTLVFAQHATYDYGFDVTRMARRQLARRAPIVVRDRSGDDIQLRQEIRQLEQDQDVWTLYILGLSMMQHTDQLSPMSHYAIAGLCRPFFVLVLHRS
jgi:tyrosinase